MSTCPHALRHDIAEPPKLMRHLPIDKRGYPVPWFVDWLPNGEPEFRAMDRRKFNAAIDDKLCWTCGNKLFGEQVFCIGPMCAVNRLSSEPASHWQCAVYAAQNCPFLSKPQMVRRKDGLTDVGAAAGEMIERNPGVTLLWYTRYHRILEIRNRPGAGNGRLFQLGRAYKVEWYCRGRIATRAEIVDSIESGIPLLREQAAKYDGPEGVIHLENQITKAWRLVPKQ